MAELQSKLAITNQRLTARDASARKYKVGDSIGTTRSCIASGLHCPLAALQMRPDTARAQAVAALNSEATAAMLLRTVAAESALQRSAVSEVTPRGAHTTKIQHVPWCGAGRCASPQGQALTGQRSHSSRAGGVAAAQAPDCQAAHSCCPGEVLGCQRSAAFLSDVLGGAGIVQLCRHNTCLREPAAQQAEVLSVWLMLLWQAKMPSNLF